MSALRGITLLDALVLLIALVTTWQKMSWEVAGRVTLVDLLQALFIGLFLLDRFARRDRRLAPVAITLMGFALLFLAVHLVGFLGLDTTQAAAQWTKGIVKWALFFGFVILAAAHIARRGVFLWVRALAAFVIGVAISAAYGIVQTALRSATGTELDGILIAPIFTGARSLGANLYGVVSTYDTYGVTSQSAVYRLTGFNEDPNHLGVLAALPFLVVLALVIGGTGAWVERRRTVLAAVGALLLVAILLTQSRSGLLGLGVGVLMLLLWYRRRFFNRQVLIGGGAIAAIGIIFASSRWTQVQQLLASRFSTDSRSSQAHVELYSLILPVLEQAPLFGLGLNNFAVFYQFQTGRADFGPHSFFVATFTETGIVGALVWLGFLVWIGSRLRLLVRAPRLGFDAPGYAAATVQALGRGLAAGFAATLVGNIFYLTMIFNAFYVAVLLFVTAPAVFGVQAAVRRRRTADLRAQSPSAT